MKNIKAEWGAIESQPKDKLKEIAMDLYNGKIYCDRHSGNMTTSVFMVLMFMGPKKPNTPSYPNDGNSVAENRDNNIYDVLQREKDQKKYEEDLKDYKLAKKIYKKEYLTSIGFIYEYLTEAVPMSVNGQPIFYSARFLNKQDTEKMFKYYEKYKKIREEVDNF
jgi:hypothetical protein